MKMDARLCNHKCVDCNKESSNCPSFYRLYGKYYCEPCFVWQTRYKRLFIFRCAVCGLNKVHDGRVSYCSEGSPVCSTKCAMHWFIQNELSRMLESQMDTECQLELEDPPLRRLGSSQ